MAPLFHAGLIFVEHRFYGQSLPFTSELAGRSSQYSSYTASQLKLLSVRQVLADIIYLIAQLREQQPALFTATTPVIACGVGYSGMLATWLRRAYPSQISASWASSAPLNYFIGGGVHSLAFYQVLSTVVTNFPHCHTYKISYALKAMINGYRMGKEFENSSKQN